MWTYMIYMITSIAIGTVAIKCGLLEKLKIKNTIKNLSYKLMNKMISPKTLLYSIEKYQLINKIFSKQTLASFTINDSGKSAFIVYSRCGKDYMINVPYKRELVTQMSKCKVFLSKNNEMINITQQPGIPYLVSAKMLGGDKIIMNCGETVKEFLNDEIPSFSQ